MNARRRAAALRRSRAARFSRVPPRRWFWICRAAPGGAFFAPLWGALDVPPAAAEIAGSRPGRRADFLRAQEVGGRRALKGGSLEEGGGAKLAPLENPPTAHVQPAASRRLVPLHPTSGCRKARQNPRRKTTPVPGVRALCARARRSRAVFRLPVGAARHAKAAVPPRAHFRYGSGDSPAEALRPRRGGWRDAVNSFVHP